MRHHRAKYAFEPERYERELVGIFEAVSALDDVDAKQLARVLARFPKDGSGLFSKSELIRGVRHLAPRFGWDPVPFARKVRMKPVRTQSGVAPVTVLTKPWPCPGRCIFCPNDVRMPKSYLAMEPGAQRAAQNRFDPYAQTMARLYAFFVNGHLVDKVELIILGGTWSFYPESYQIWFIKRCFDAMNDFAGEFVRPDERHVDFEDLDVELHGSRLERTYNQVVSDFLSDVPEFETATWEALEAAHETNETSGARCVGLVVETRPDHIDEAEVERIRRLGATKVQIGYQSMSDEVLAANKRGHDVAATRRAMRLLRQAGFKIHAHWMPNLYGSSVDHDREDFRVVFDDPAFRPDELKIYPTSLIESAELMAYWERGDWRPYDDEELVSLLVDCLARVPRYCRVTRVIRDIPSHDIVIGNKTSNLREVAEKRMREDGVAQHDIRSREIRGQTVAPDALHTKETTFETSTSNEVFLEYVNDEDRIAGFLRLSLPKTKPFIEELAVSAIIREVHVYGAVVGLGDDAGGRAQHAGLGRQLVTRAIELAREHGYEDVAVIAAIGTRDYYRSLGFEDGRLYQHRSTRRS